MPDTRYLWQRRGSRWYCRIAVPSDLQKRLGKTAIQQNLDTSNLKEAQERRWSVVAEVKGMFQRLREGGPLTESEIDALSKVELRQTYDDIAQSFHKNEDWRLVLGERLSELQLDLKSTFLQLDVFSDEEKWVPIPLRQDAETMIAKAGAEPSEESIRTLCTALAKAQIAAIESFINGVEPPLAERPQLIARRRRQGRGVSFSEVAERYFAERTRDPAARWTGQTEKQYRASCRLFADFVGAAPVNAITRGTAAEFLDTIATLQPNYARSRTAKDLNLTELLERFPGPPGLSNKTLNRHATALNSLFKWARRRGLYSGVNPFADQSRPEGQAGWLPFTSDELELLFRHPLLEDASYRERVRPARHSAQSALMWVPMLALFSGLRQDEICGMRTADMQEADGVLFFNVEEHEGRRIKSVAATRRVPVHSALIRTGFGDYLKHVASDEYLFPGLRPGGPDGKRSWYFSKAFTAFRRTAGVTRPRVNFHSFRKNVVEALERARVHQSEVAQIVGHERGFTFSVYSPLGLDVDVLRKVVERIDYPDLDLSHLQRQKRRRSA